MDDGDDDDGDNDDVDDVEGDDDNDDDVERHAKICSWRLDDDDDDDDNDDDVNGCRLRDLLRQGGQGVAVQGEQGEGGDSLERAAGERTQQVEPKIQNLRWLFFSFVSLTWSSKEDVNCKRSRNNKTLRCIAWVKSQPGRSSRHGEVRNCWKYWTDFKCWSSMADFGSQLLTMGHLKPTARLFYFSPNVSTGWESGGSKWWKNHILQIFCWHWPSFKDSCWTFSLSCCIQSCINEQQCLNLERAIFHTEPPLIQTIYTTASILILWNVQQKYFKMQHDFSHNNPVFSLYST